MADHDYTSENPEDNICEEKNQCEEEKPTEVIEITEPEVIWSKSNQKTAGSLKSEIIREFNQFLTLDEIKHMDRDEAKKYGVDLIHICVLFSCELQTRIPYINTHQYEISINDEVTIEDKRTIRFKYDHTATRDNSIHVKGLCKGSDSHVLVFAKEDKNTIYERDILEEEDFYFILDKSKPSDTYIISIWAKENKTISTYLKVWKEDVIDTLIDERGAIWINKNDVDFIKNIRFIKLRWYLPKELVGVLLGILERKVRGESDGLIRQAYDSGVMPLVGVMLALISLFTSGIANIILFFGGTMITFGEPKEYYNKLYWEVDEITGRYREGAVEKFKNGCVIEIYDEYKPAPQMQYNPGVTDTILKNIVKVSAWDNPQEQMRGELGYRGIFISNNSPDAEEEFSSFSLER